MLLFFQALILWNIPSEKYLNNSSVLDPANTSGKHGPALFDCIIATRARCFAAEAPECSGELRRRQDSAAGGGFAAPRAARVSTQLRDWCNSRQLPASAALLHHRVGKVCEEHPAEVRTNILLFFRRATDGVLNIYWSIWWLSEYSNLKHFFSSFFTPPHTHTGKASESSQSLKLAWLRYTRHVISTAIPSISLVTQVIFLTD